MHVTTDDSTHRSLLHLRRLAWLMDAQFQIPGTRFRAGLDGLIGLIPGVGDVIGALISLYIIFHAAKLGATKGMLLRMILNVAIEALIGAIPILGDLFDIAFKANVRNLKILGIDLNEEPRPFRKRV